MSTQMWCACDSPHGVKQDIGPWGDQFGCQSIRCPGAMPDVMLSGLLVPVREHFIGTKTLKWVWRKPKLFEYFMEYIWLHFTFIFALC